VFAHVDTEVFGVLNATNYAHEIC